MSNAPADAHRPVLLDECLEALAIRPDGRYADGTFGRGGHSRAILAQLGPQGRLLATDRDPQAVEAARAIDDPRFEIVHAPFSRLPEAVRARGWGAADGTGGLDGLLLDLGVSSPQLDDASRGFSFRHDGPLDMRMDPTSGLSAREWLRQASERDIARVLDEYGEERAARAIARAIAARFRDAGDEALRTTGELATLVAGIVRRQPGKDPATRTFQALRIAVNGELDEVEALLAETVSLLNPGGRLAVISFHSLEDRLVKRFMARESGRTLAGDETRERAMARRMGLPVPEAPARLALLPRVLPSEAETAVNVRARSAVLRVAERLPPDARA